MSGTGDLDVLKKRALWLCSRSLLELEVVLTEALRNELPGHVVSNDRVWLKDLVRVLELDDYILLDAILGKEELGADYDRALIETLQLYLPGRAMYNDEGKTIKSDERN